MIRPSGCSQCLSPSLGDLPPRTLGSWLRHPASVLFPGVAPPACSRGFPSTSLPTTRCWCSAWRPATAPCARPTARIGSTTVPGEAALRSFGCSNLSGGVSWRRVAPRCLWRVRARPPTCEGRLLRSVWKRRGGQLGEFMLAVDLEVDSVVRTMARASGSVGCPGGPAFAARTRPSVLLPGRDFGPECRLDSSSILRPSCGRQSRSPGGAARGAATSYGPIEAHDGERSRISSRDIRHKLAYGGSSRRCLCRERRSLAAIRHDPFSRLPAGHARPLDRQPTENARSRPLTRTQFEPP